MIPERGPQTVCSSEFIRTATTKVGRNPLGPVPTYAALCAQNRLPCLPQEQAKSSTNNGGDYW